jgi:hypothetical protein
VSRFRYNVSSTFWNYFLLACFDIATYYRRMNPKLAIETLQARGWSIIQIAERIGMNRANVYKALNDDQLPSYLNGVALVELAKSGRKPPRKEKVA